MNWTTRHLKSWNIAASSLGAIFIFLLSAALPAAATQSVTLAWVPSTDPAVAGFRIYYGPASRAYTNYVVAGNITNTTITGLTDATTYYFAATTYDNAGRQSAFSDEITYLTPTPPVNPIDTNTVPVITNTPPVITNTPPNITNTPPFITNTPPFITNTPPDITNTPPFITNTPPFITNTPPDITNTPPFITNTPPFITNTPPFITNTPPFITNTPPFITNTPPVDTSALPKLNPIANLTLTSGGGLRGIVLTGLSAGKEESRIVSVTASSSDTNLISNLNFQLASSRTAGTLTFRPATNALGSATVTVTVRNNQAANNTFSRSFTVMLVAANPVSNLRPPTFFRKPGSTVVITGRNVSFAAGATGKGLLKYAWKFNGKTIPGATGSTLTLKKVTAAQAGAYSVTVSSAFGSTNSLAALTVYESPAAKLGEMTRLTNGNFAFPITGVPGYKYVVQATTDLQQWTSVATNTSPFVFEDTHTAENEKRFFRAYYDPAL